MNALTFAQRLINFFRDNPRESQALCEVNEYAQFYIDGADRVSQTCYQEFVFKKDWLDWSDPGDYFLFRAIADILMEQYRELHG